MHTLSVPNHHVVAYPTPHLPCVEKCTDQRTRPRSGEVEAQQALVMNDLAVSCFCIVATTPLPTGPVLGEAGAIKATSHHNRPIVMVERSRLASV
jgi:hypothetical protein